MVYDIVDIYNSHSPADVKNLSLKILATMLLTNCCVIQYIAMFRHQHT